MRRWKTLRYDLDQCGSSVKTAAIYGGAFDPPHLGHVEVVRKTLELPNVSSVLVVPSRNPPHKTPTLGFRRRMHMTRLVTRDAFPKSRVVVSNIESRILGITYMVDVLRYLLRSEKMQYSLVLGADEVWSIMKWKHPDTIFGRVGMIIVNRPGSGEPDSSKLSNVVAAAIERAPRIDIDEGFSVSSSAIRSSIAVESGWWREFVPKSIVKYIEKNGLYGYGKGL